MSLGGRFWSYLYLKPTIPEANNAAVSPNSGKNTTLKRSYLIGRSDSYREGHLQMLEVLIRKNKTLSTLGLRLEDDEAQYWKDRLFPALKENATLQELDLSFSGGLNGKGVQEALLDLLRSNARLINVKLADTDISYLESRVNEELRVNQEYRAKLQGRAKAPSASGRLVL